MIGIVDLGWGNIASIKNAVEFIGKTISVLHSPSRIDECDRIILPGVGSFYASMSEIKRCGFNVALKEFSARGGRILGICLGMQLLASLGTENGDIEGIGIIPGRVRKMNVPYDLRLPHVGWNGVSPTQEHSIFKGIKKEVDFYFTHSYVFEVEDEAHAVGKTLYGENFTSVVAAGNVWGVQFHPEKSQKNGIRILKNFLEEEAKEC